MIAHFFHVPPLRYHILGPTFTWSVFFKGMDTDGDGQFDIDEFITAIVKVYHDVLLNEDGSTHVATAGTARTTTMTGACLFLLCARSWWPNPNTCPKHLTHKTL